MMNRFLLAVVIVFLLVNVFEDDISTLTGWQPTYAFEVAQMAALILVIFNGTFLSSIYFKTSLFMFGGVALGAVSKILHLPLADYVLVMPLLLLPSIYAFHFVSKKQKNILDVLKLSFVSSHFIISVLVILHLVSGPIKEYALIFRDAIFWIMIFYFILYSFRKKTLFGA
jgi:hypothetical protein